MIFGVDTKRWMAEYIHGFVLLRWKVMSRNEDTAVVSVSDFEASLAAAGYQVTLRKVGTEGVVVDHKMPWIS